MDPAICVLICLPDDSEVHKGLRSTELDKNNCVHDIGMKNVSLQKKRQNLSCTTYNEKVSFPFQIPY